MITLAVLVGLLLAVVAVVRVIPMETPDDAPPEAEDWPEFDDRG